MAEIPVRSFAVSVFLLRRVVETVQVLMMRRTGPTLPGQWCQVAGGIDAGEKAWQAALREAKEETGLTLDNLYSADICEQFYEADRDAITLTPVFVGYVQPESKVVLNHEHSEYHWASFHEATEMVSFAGQRSVLEHVRREFAERAPNPLLLIQPKA